MIEADTHVHSDGMVCELRGWTWVIIRNPRGQHADEPCSLFMACPGLD